MSLPIAPVMTYATIKESRARKHPGNSNSLSAVDLLPHLQAAGSQAESIFRSKRVATDARLDLDHSHSSDSNDISLRESRSQESERKLQKGRELAESSVKKLYDDRKDSILEIFQSSWIISDALEDELD